MTFRAHYLLAVSLLLTCLPALGVETYQLSIPAQPLAKALQAFATQSGLSLVHYAKVTEAKMAPALEGAYTPEEALARLLEGTGLQYIHVNERTIEIRPAAHRQAEVRKISEEKTEGWNGSFRVAQAQTEGLPRTDSSSGNSAAPGLEEIVVTAERREELAQDVPISMSVFSGDFLKQYIGDTSELADFVPNFQITATPGELFSAATIRGLGTDNASNALASTSILTYYDGIAAGTPLGSAMPLWDLDRIEVLRGPQGTLFGRNAVAGAIRYISAAPTDEFAGYGELTAGEFDLRRFEGAVSGPITENVKARLSALVYDRGGDVTNVFTNTKIGNREWWGVRGIVDWQIAENFDARVKAQIFEFESAPFFLNATPSDLMSPGDRAWLDAIGADPDLGRESNFEKSQYGLPNLTRKGSADVVEVDLNYDFGPVVLSAVGGYLEGEQGGAFELFSYPAPMADALDPMELTQWSGEIRLTSQTDHPLQWVGGAYYQQSKDSWVVGLDFTALLRDLDGDGLTRHNADSPEDLLDGLIPVFPVSTVYQEVSSAQELETSAFFLHTTYDWTDRLKTTHAVRHTRESKDIDYLFNSFFEFPVSFGVTPGTLAEFNDFFNFARLTPAQRRQQAVSIISDPNAVDADGNVVPTRFSESWEELTWRFAADYRLTDDALVYSSISKGFRGGIFPVFVSPETAVAADPETSIVYEVGTKTQWFDNRLQVNVSAFYNEHSDYQTNLFVPLGAGGSLQRLANLPKAELYGGEIEIQTVPMDNLFVVASFGVLDSEITEVLPGNEALLGNEIPFAEDFNFAGMVRYDVPMGLGTFSPQLSWNYRGKYWSFQDNNDITGQQGDFWTMDVRLGYESPNSKLYGLFYLKNLFDEVHPDRMPGVASTSSGSKINERRNWGVTLGYRF